MELAEAGPTVGQHDLSGRGSEGEGGEWGSVQPSILQLEGSIALSEKRPQ